MVTLAMCKPAKLVTCREPNSAALNRTLTAGRVRANARWIADSGVLPIARDEYESASHIKCQPTPRIAASSSVATVSIASAHPLENGSWRRVNSLGRMHPSRRKIVLIFTVAGFPAAGATGSGQDWK